jgi:calcineurin-like phosphoesterase family protein
VLTRSLILCATLAAVLGCGEDAGLPSEPATGAPEGAGAAAVADSVMLIAAGDIHTYCDRPAVLIRAQATANIIKRYPQALVFPLGDNAGEYGTREEFQCYDRSWGAFKSRTYPVMGNHELSLDPKATPYYDYFNGVGVDSGRAGRRGKGYYALSYGGWRIFVANNNYKQPIDEQTAWMAREMAAHPTRCTLVAWHRPLFTSSTRPAGVHTPSHLPTWWKTLYNGRAEVILNSHVHNYERFAEMRPDGVVDTTRGLREFVVGTGGAGLYAFDAVLPHSAKRVSTWGVLLLTLWPTRYKWQFIDTAGVVRDSGRDTCR